MRHVLGLAWLFGRETLAGPQFGERRPEESLLMNVQQQIRDRHCRIVEDYR